MKRLIRSVSLIKFRLEHFGKESFICPICQYKGPFEDFAACTGTRKHAICPKCGSLERHRLQYLVLNEIFANKDTAKLKMLHFAPERFFRKELSKKFGQYETADLNAVNVDHKVDLQKLPFDDKTYDFVFASHVLEHIQDDIKAISEIRRILRPNGLAVLPVPIIAERTIEYPAPNSNEAYHVRAPGFDYFDRDKLFFSRVDLFNSESFAEKYQLFVYEDRSIWPTVECPFRPAMYGEKHIDIVPVCYV